MTHVAVLGAGIMGASTALFLARRRVRVSLFDEAARPFTGASRWNEGKIHLGYLYAADPSLATAKRLLPGGLAFKSLTEELIGCSLVPATTRDEDTFVVHRDSVVDTDTTEQYFRAVASLVESHRCRGRYLAPIISARPVRLSRREMEAEYDASRIAGAFRVVERSVSTLWVADRFVDALSAEPRIEQRMDARIVGVRRVGAGDDSALVVRTAGGDEGPFDHVVNALWQGRLAIDAGLALPLPDTWSHRYRLSVFLRTSREVEAPNTVVSTGPFGDIKNYNGRDFYLSWYLAGLLAEGVDVAPPALPAPGQIDRARIVDAINDRIGRIVRRVADVRTHAEHVRLEGGWVCARGGGSLADPSSTLHRRDRIGITRSGSYISVDTGKYSVAPWLARHVADQIAGRGR